MEARLKVRLIKQKISTSREKEHHEHPPDEPQIIDTIRSWVREFKSRKANKARSDFLRIDTSRKDI